MPPDSSAHANSLPPGSSPPALICVALLIPLTATGAVLHGEEPQVSGPVLVPSPSAPSELLLQQSIPPPDSKAQGAPPALMLRALVIRLTFTGTVLHALAPQASGPVLLPSASPPSPLLARVRTEYPLLPIDDATASSFARIADEELTAGRKLRRHDAWIAATAARHGASVVTQDADFTAFSSVQVIRV